MARHRIAAVPAPTGLQGSLSLRSPPGGVEGDASLRVRAMLSKPEVFPPMPAESPDGSSHSSRRSAEDREPWLDAFDRLSDTSQDSQEEWFDAEPGPAGPQDEQPPKPLHDADPPPAGDAAAAAMPPTAGSPRITHEASPRRHAHAHQRQGAGP